ncbi:MC036R [Molluscum contagiosum virus]|uniref:MC036R n=2 Tax=Molluscum contagiosum virus TaxID=10279 RepID=A0A858A6V8_9POXV|nr:MC036 [Molluscum contagiosum virus subtype 2]QHW18195.1 MC036R [Molluscum contagiosum virus]QHW18543.1 MC036R [Molluscum contagiosum virus]DBA39799.1 TPA_asm: MC036R [Molluscum contagiosum virus]
MSQSRASGTSSMAMPMLALEMIPSPAELCHLAHCSMSCADMARRVLLRLYPEVVCGADSEAELPAIYFDAVRACVSEYYPLVCDEYVWQHEGLLPLREFVLRCRLVREVSTRSRSPEARALDLRADARVRGFPKLEPRTPVPALQPEPSQTGPLSLSAELSATSSHVSEGLASRLERATPFVPCPLFTLEESVPETSRGLLEGSSQEVFARARLEEEHALRALADRARAGTKHVKVREPLRVFETTREPGRTHESAHAPCQQYVAFPRACQESVPRAFVPTDARHVPLVPPACNASCRASEHTPFEQPAHETCPGTAFADHSGKLEAVRARAQGSAALANAARLECAEKTSALRAESEILAARLEYAGETFALRAGEEDAVLAGTARLELSEETVLVPEEAVGPLSRGNETVSFRTEEADGTLPCENTPFFPEEVAEEISQDEAVPFRIERAVSLARAEGTFRIEEAFAPPRDKEGSVSLSNVEALTRGVDAVVPLARREHNVTLSRLEKVVRERMEHAAVRARPNNVPLANGTSDSCACPDEVPRANEGAAQPECPEEGATGDHHAVLESTELRAEDAARSLSEPVPREDASRPLGEPVLRTVSPPAARSVIVPVPVRPAAGDLVPLRRGAPYTPSAFVQVTPAWAGPVTLDIYECASSVSSPGELAVLLLHKVFQELFDARQLRRCYSCYGDGRTHCLDPARLQLIRHCVALCFPSMSDDGEWVRECVSRVNSELTGEELMDVDSGSAEEDDEETEETEEESRRVTRACSPRAQALHACSPRAQPLRKSVRSTRGLRRSQIRARELAPINFDTLCIPPPEFYVPSCVPLPTRAHLRKMYGASRSIYNFAVRMLVYMFPELFTAENLHTHFNCYGSMGKRRLDPLRLRLLRHYVQLLHPAARNERVWITKFLACLDERCRRRCARTQARTPRATRSSFAPIRAVSVPTPDFYVPAQYLISAKRVKELARRSSCPGHFAAQLTVMLFPELFSSCTERQKFSCAGSDEHLRLDPVRVRLIRHYVRAVCLPGAFERTWEAECVPSIDARCQQPGMRRHELLKRSICAEEDEDSSDIIYE